MTELTIARLTATLHPIPGFDDGGRIDAMLHHLAERRLDDGLSRLALPDGEWCVRRVDVEMSVDPDDRDTTIETDWAEAVLQSLKRALARPSANEVVHYRDRERALDELVARVALGDVRHAWAWRQLGVLTASDPSPDTDPSGAVLAALDRAPEHSLRAVLAAVQLVGGASLHKLLGVDGWVRLATVVATATGMTPSSARQLVVGEQLVDRPPQADVRPLVERAQRVLGESTFASAMIRSRLRPAGVASPWAVLAIAEADPAALRRSQAVDLVAFVAAALDRSDSTETVGLVTTDRSPSSVSDRPIAQRRAHATDVADTSTMLQRQHALGETSAPARVSRRAPAADDRAAREIADDHEVDSQRLDASVGEEGDGRVRASTVWAGLLFLLSTADAVGVPDGVMEDPRLLSRSIRWVLHQLAQMMLPIAGADAAALAFAGLPPDADAPGGSGASATERSALAEVAARWAAATAERMDRADADEFECVRGVALRRGEIVAERGWIDVHLAMDEVDIDVRRAGLDLDPGWMPWLGVVVRFLYD